LQLSFIDRLVDTKGAKRTANEWAHARELRATLCRDLSDLLNTRRAPRDFDVRFDEATNSILSYGIPDFTQYDLRNTAEQERVRISIERAVRQFEPRLTRVKVTLEPPNPVNPTLRFQIEAQLRDESDMEDVLFDATVQRESRRISVSGAE
jgi:type VI secretion system protein ImpF